MAMIAGYQYVNSKKWNVPFDRISCLRSILIEHGSQVVFRICCKDDKRTEPRIDAITECCGVAFIFYCVVIMLICVAENVVRIVPETDRGWNVSNKVGEVIRVCSIGAVKYCLSIKVAVIASIAKSDAVDRDNVPSRAIDSPVQRLDCGCFDFTSLFYKPLFVRKVAVCRAGEDTHRGEIW